MFFLKHSSGQLRLRDFKKLVEIQRHAAHRKNLLVAPDLTYLFWESTLRCNLRCSHCGSSCEATSPLTELTTSQILTLFDTIAEDFDPTRIFVSITGGEPLLRPDLFQVVEHLTGLGMRSCIVTNGTLLGMREAEKLVEAGMRTLTISVDGLQAEHEAVRGKGTYAKALEALHRARLAGFVFVEAITCVRPANLSSLRTLEGTVRDAGANLWRLITIDRMGRLEGKEAPDLWLDGRGVRALFDFIEERRAVHAESRTVFDLRFSCGGFLGMERELEVRPGNGQCYAGLSVGSILCDGQVGACPSLPRSWAQGSALETRFSTLWYERFKDYRNLHWRRSGICKDCSWFSVCLGGGLHERLAQPDAFCWLDRQDED